jgi:Flp pilus assembly protein TadB
MLLLMNRRNRTLGAVLGAIAALAFLAIGIATANVTFVIRGLVSLALTIWLVFSIARTRRQQRPAAAQPER